MRNDETLIKQAELLTALASAGDDLRSALKVQSPQMASLAVKKLFATVDAFRETIRREPYYPAMGETVTVQGIVDELRNDGTVRVRFGDGDYDYEWVDPRLVPVRPV